MKRTVLIVTTCLLLLLSGFMSKTSPCQYQGIEVSFPELIQQVDSSVVHIMIASNGTVHGVGSGFLVKENVILTAAHVIKKFEYYKGDFFFICVEGGTQFMSRICCVDENHDFSFIKIEDCNLAPLCLGDSNSLDVGENIFVIGTPFGLTNFNSVSCGIVSGLNREVMGERCFQVDTAVNPGNSGGPVFNMQGEVVGIAFAAILSGNNIGYILPINIVDFSLADNL